MGTAGKMLPTAPITVCSRYPERRLGSMGQELVCANCGIVIVWEPTIVEGRGYCCPGCAQGGPCNCDYDNLPRSGHSNPIVLQEDCVQRSGKSD